jgi:CSLREA domain-containing protein
MKRVMLAVFVSIAVVSGVILLARPGTQASPDATYTVNSTGDPGVGTCDATECTLREAIAAANANAGTDTIEFNIPGAGPHTIRPGSALPTITDPVIIDGTSEPDFTGTPIIELDGTNAGAGVDGLRITAGNSTVKGLVINRFRSDGIELSSNGGNVIQGNYIGTDTNGTADLGNSAHGVNINGVPNNTIGGTAAGAGNVISGNNGRGVYIIATGATGNVVQGNYIGTDKNGTADLGNSGDGVLIISAASNTIGGTAAGAGNVISGNDWQGVFISGSGATGNVVQGNYIGTDKNGTADLGNYADGVRIDAGPGNTIGGTAAGAGNVISGNGSHGVHISGSSATGNQVQGNLIGTDKNGTADLGNLAAGVDIDAAPANTIGGTTEEAGNVISGNDWHGVYIAGSGATGNQVQGNLIGTDKNGTADLGNSFDGVVISGVPSNTIGGTAAGAGNVISGNNGRGVYITATGATGNVVQGNCIGTDKNGTADLGNSAAGVRIDAAPGNTIGGTAAGAANTIAHNAADGVRVDGPTATGNTIRGNSIYSNGGRGIENTNAGNGELAPPIVDSVGSVSGHTNPKCYPCTVEVFSDDDAEGRIYEGSVSTNDDGNGSWFFPGSVSGPHVTATVTNAGGNTSEFWGDVDGDGVHVDVDNCPIVYNPNQINSDTDSHGDACDNCPNTDNETQADADSDGAGDACDVCTNDPKNDTDKDGICAGSGYLPPKTGDNDNCPADYNPSQDNGDGDSWGDACDYCPTTATPWYVPLGDGDCDGFTDAVEGVVGSDPGDACPDWNGSPGACPGLGCDGDDCWPVDLDVNTHVNVLDILFFKPALSGPYNPRYDLNGDTAVNVLDILLYKPFVNTFCTNP